MNDQILSSPLLYWVLLEKPHIPPKYNSKFIRLRRKGN